MESQSTASKEPRGEEGEGREGGGGGVQRE